MNLARTCLIAALLGITAASAAAQDGTSSADEKRTLQRVWIKLADSDKEVTGRLLNLDQTTVSIEVKRDSRLQRLDLPLARVVRIRQKVHDTLLDGALLLGGYVAACSIWWCNQGMDRPASQPQSMLLGAAVGALIGAGIDSRIYRRKTIFDATGPGSAVLSPSVSLTLRF